MYLWHKEGSGIRREVTAAAALSVLAHLGAAVLLYAAGPLSGLSLIDSDPRVIHVTWVHPADTPRPRSLPCPDHGKTQRSTGGPPPSSPGDTGRYRNRSPNPRSAKRRRRSPRGAPTPGVTAHFTAPASAGRSAGAGEQSIRGHCRTDRRRTDCPPRTKRSSPRNRATAKTPVRTIR